MALVIQNLYKSFEGYVALDRINLSIENAEFVCLLGPSGCGKTTLLRIIAGLLSCDGGKITLDDRDLVNVPARERGFGIVFQSYSLFPHMTIAQNIGYGLKIRQTPAEEVAARVSDLLDTVRLSGFGDRYPAQLSGGQQQRVAIARALAVNPSLLLLDEPLSALDARVRAGLRQELRDVQQRLGIPTLMVTHDQEEAMSMADKIICMHGGRIVQEGTPHELYTSPRTRFVAEFMGHSNLLSRDVVNTWMPELLPSSLPEGAELFIRPERIALHKAEGAEGRVINTSFLGSIQRIQVVWKSQPLLVETSSAVNWNPGDPIHLSIRAEDCAWVQS
ncbi:ABC transporter ATP-binding protein [Pectobacterium brasiliense]|uniref:ABC transporter ATP-binding protein n=1 Tax=Pectobacterium brasiliense TaxID=180957 RepID=UPI0004E627F9|nr:ABC transporter ATP-binding protein [Pectobacterium brasiliense]GLY60947.1 ABC transporter ATP-binding protein [Pectobacterium carotovorum subsp. carotovorum]KFF73003.1 ABC transporter [Pectobacterium brasiliense]MBN3122792.1 ABC transporter ATP-binding protein [Pectobacterium brasiliense]MBN3197447.1 ABC transporter ATP-binding protein [Pectobacterium brasiliense]QSD21290.1 ABC transporter ATP-binding protein [Pectobacterium brasiliense]